MMTLQCPKCNVPGFVVEYEGVELDMCPDCGGIWFDRGELDLVLGHDHPVEKNPAHTQEDHHECPICLKKMDKVNIGPKARVLVDSCPNECGIWFDQGELGELTRNLQEEGWHIAPEVREFLCGMFPGVNTDPDGE